MISTEDADTLQQLSLEDGLKFISEKFSDGVVFSTWLGQEDQVIPDIIFRQKLPIKVFKRDTGRFFCKHYDLLSKNNSKYKAKTEVYLLN